MDLKKKKINHRGHREIIVLKKKKPLRTQRKKENKNSVISVLKKSWVKRWALCFLLILLFDF